MTAATEELETKKRINRNIVECKWSSAMMESFFCRELIETLWNVNQA